jgi:hypothetical protein
MVNETRKNVNVFELGFREQVNCVEQYINIICPYEEFTESFEEVLLGIKYFVEATPDQFYFDENGDWYDEGKKVR